MGKTAAPISMYVWTGSGGRLDWARLQHLLVMIRVRRGVGQAGLGCNTWWVT